MKVKLMVMLLVFVLAAAIPSFAQDVGDPDTLIMVAPVFPTAGADDSTLILEVWSRNDAEMSAISCGWGWDNDNVELDSAKASAGAMAVWNFFIFYDGNSIATTNANKRFLFSGINMMGMGNLPSSTERQLLATYYFTVSSWSPSDEIVLDTTHWDDGSELFYIPIQTAGIEFKPVWFWGTGGMTIKDPSDVSPINDGLIPETYGLAQNYPNPFNPTTEIVFGLPQASSVNLSVYNVLGQHVKTIVDEELAAGSHSVEWDGTSESNTEVASGVYFYRLDAGSFSETKKMVLLK